MARELQCDAAVSLTLYALVFSADLSTAWNTDTEEMDAFVLVAIADNRLTATDQTGLGNYTADMPAVPAGKYNFIFVDGDDERISAGVIYWDGTAEVPDVSELEAADKYIDNADDAQWYRVWIRKGSGDLDTGTELLRKTLNNVNGVPLINDRTVAGQAISE
jgi:hypothetical protein